ncbi:MAG: DUF2834 domain-containing protein [Thermoanaerobaculia bacterium]
MKRIYLALAVAGFVFPVWQFVLFFADHGAGVMEFIRQMFVNHAAAGVSADLLVTLAVFWVFLGADRWGVRHKWLYVILSLSVGVAFSLSLYLFAREARRPQAGALQGTAC